MAGNNVTGVMKEFGEIMMKLYSKSHDYRKNDFSLNYLGLVTIMRLMSGSILWLIIIQLLD